MQNIVRVSTTNNFSAATVSVSEIALHLQQRINWYGLEGFAVRSLGLRDPNTIVAVLTDGHGVRIEEDIDRSTGRVRGRRFLKSV